MKLTFGRLVWAIVAGGISAWIGAMISGTAVEGVMFMLVLIGCVIVQYMLYPLITR
jgi:hypothetical protein